MLPTWNSRKTNLAAVAAMLALTVTCANAHTASKKAPKASREKTAEDTFVAPLKNEVLVSDREYNHFIFPAAITQMVFPGNAVNQPVYLGDYSEVLIRPHAGITEPIQMIVELENKQVVTMYLRPSKIHGIIYKAGSKRDFVAAEQDKARQSGDVLDAPSAPNGADIELLKIAVTGAVPDGFESKTLPAASRFDKYTAVPMKALSNGMKTIYVFSLVAANGQTAVVAPTQFYKEGITAVLLDGDVVDESHTPFLYVVKESNDE